MRIRTFGGLWIEGPTGSPALGPRRLALLALIAAAGKKGISRDRVIGILWPEAEEEQARHTLSQTIYTLKKDTGCDWISPGSDLRLDPAITSEIGDLKEALAAGTGEMVENLAGAVFLDGFYLAGAPEFERWVEEERGRLRSAMSRALEQAAARADLVGEHARAIRVWTLLTDLDPLSSRFATGRMRALAAGGDRASALAYARTYEGQVRRELDTEVDPAVRQLVAELRSETKSVVASGSLPGAEPTTTDATARTPTGTRSGKRRWAAAALLVPLVVAGAFLLLRPRAAAGPPVLAVGDIEVEPDTDTTRLGTVLRDMLATSLSGIDGMQVIANSRLVELLPRDNDQPGAASSAARRAGATELIEGDLQSEADGLVLSLRRVALDNGVLRKGYVLRARDRYAIVDSAAALIARDFGLAAPATSVAEIRTASPAAYALYDEGLRAHYAFDDPAAYRLMTAALARDSNFAMAAFYAWRLARSMSLPDSIRLRALDLTKRLMDRAAEPERLLIRATVSDVEAPVAVTTALVDTLSIKYPLDPDVQMLLAGHRGSLGDWAGAVAAYDRAFVLDSAAGAIRGPYCRICMAVGGMVQASLWADSAEAAIRAMRRLMAVQPDEPAHRSGVAEPLLRLGRRAEVETILGTGWASSGMMLRDLLRWGRHEEADRILTTNAVSLDWNSRTEGKWLLLLSLRDQGRLREADTLFRLQRLPNTNHRLPFPESVVPVDLALLGVEMGRPELTVRAHRANAAGHLRTTREPALRARSVVWNLTLAGTAHAAAGDTGVVRRLADSIEVLGRQSNWNRDVRLHYVLRGLLHQQAGRHEEAVDAFRKSMFSITDGFTRTNLMLARSLLALRRPEEAIAILRPAIRGGVDGSNTYVSRTELREALAQAFEMAGQADSARAHWREVESAWRRADPQFRERYLTARAKAGL